MVGAVRTYDPLIKSQLRRDVHGTVPIFKLFRALPERARLCHFTIMQARGGKRMAKTLLSNGAFLNYDDAFLYNAATVQLDGLADLWRVLHSLLPLHDRCVVRGRLAHGDCEQAPPRRKTSRGGASRM